MVITNRKKMKNSRRRAIQKSAQKTFIVAICAVVLYFFFYFIVFDLVDGSGADWQLLSFLFWIHDMILLGLYAAIFAGLTRAFMLLGMMEYLGVKK
jgi:bacteriorhodopsin